MWNIFPTHLWNGKKKELLEREEEVEQRGVEIGQQ